MTPEFELFYNEHLAKVEGGYSDQARDRGRRTWYGITEKFLHDIGTTGPITKSQAKQYAFEYFWEPNGCQQMDPVAAWCYCDALFNHTGPAATRMLQHALQVSVDGVNGPATAKAATRVNHPLFIRLYRVERVRYYVAIVQNDPTQITFLVGWVERVQHLTSALLTGGLLADQIRTLPWYSPANYSATTKSAGIGVGMFGAVIALFWPDVDLASLPNDASTFKAAVVGLAGAAIAKWRSRTT